LTHPSACLCLILALFPIVLRLVVTDIDIRPAVRTLLHRAELSRGEYGAPAALLAADFKLDGVLRLHRVLIVPPLGCSAFKIIQHRLGSVDVRSLDPDLRLVISGISPPSHVPTWEMSSITCASTPAARSAFRTKWASRLFAALYTATGSRSAIS